MTKKRYFSIRGAPIDGDIVRLGGTEAHHIGTVVRARTDDEIDLLDGDGVVYRARLVEISRGTALLRIVSSERSKNPPRIDMALSLIRAHRFDMAAEKCAELGIRRLIPLNPHRSVWRGGPAETQRKQERLERKVEAACKQSGQPFFPWIGPVMTIDALIGSLSGYRRVFMADISGEPVDRGEESSGDGYTLGIIGPEGGFTQDERAALAGAGAVPVSLGPSRLRSETAAICLLFELNAAYRRRS